MLEGVAYLTVIPMKAKIWLCCLSLIDYIAKSQPPKSKVCELLPAKPLTLSRLVQLFIGEVEVPQLLSDGIALALNTLCCQQ